MMHARRLSRLTSVATALLAAVLAERVLAAADTNSLLLTSTGMVLGFVAAGFLWFRSTFEAHLVALHVAVLTFIGTLLSVTIGLPGAGRTPLSVVHGALILLPPVVVGLQVALYRRLLRRRRARRTTYAA